jgi:uncharacterized membrane protein
LSLASNNTRPEQAQTTGDVTPSSGDAARLSRTRGLQLTVVAAFVIGYAALSHYSASSPDAKGLGAALSVAPVSLIGVLLAWRWTKPLTALLITASLCALLYRYWPTIERNYEWADLAQQCGAYGLIALSFARSLFAGHVPLCTQLAIQIHGVLTSGEIAYTRRATAAWGAFYALIAVTILILYFAVSLRTWSLFVNFATFGLMLLMGTVDHAIRRRVLPRHPREGILAILQRTLIG